MDTTAPESTRKPDRRIERTKTSLREALMALIVERGYESITVQDIADRANVARTTFYLHFRDKDELLFEGMRSLYEALYEQIARHEGENPLGLPYDMSSSADYEHVAQYAAFYRVMLSEQGSMSFYVRVVNWLAEMILKDLRCIPLAEGVKPQLPLELVAHYCAGAQVACIKWWLDNDLKHSPAEMGKMGELLTLYGLPWAIGGIQLPLPDDAP